MKLLYYAPYSYGGLADYAHEQATALVNLGISVTVLCSPNYPGDRSTNYTCLPILREIKPDRPLPNKLLKAIHYTQALHRNIKTLAQIIREQSFQHVLFVSYGEYLAPLWSGELKRLAQQGVVFGAVIQEPVRDFVVGPLWWHRWSVASAYSFLRQAFVHEAIALDTVRPMPQLQTTVIPYGTHQFPAAEQSAEQVRQELQIPNRAKLLLAFGHIRDNKNLHLALDAMVDYPDIYLVVAGKCQSASQRPESFYQERAEALGIGDRCRWILDFISEEQAANLFTACDLVLLTYSARFRSASGVLNLAANYRKACLASAGQGSLQAVVQHYGLGIWVAPDDVDAIRQGFQDWLTHAPQPDWDRYFAENSWALNAQLVAKQFWGDRPQSVEEPCLTGS
jgi:glycosyltransferase involved in cell wall biosynthesis